MPKNSELRIGGHVSAAGHFVEALKRGGAIGANTIQIFGSSPRQWYAKLPDKEEGLEFQRAQQKLNITPVFLHAPYLINLASSKKELRIKSITLLTSQLQIAEALGAEGVIFHLGSNGEEDRKEGILRLEEGIEKVLKATPGGAKLFLENSAGGGGKIGNSLEEIGDILKEIKNPRAGVCFDTAHAFESGLVGQEGYSREEVAKLIEKMEKHIGWKNLGVIHANDSKTPWNSKNDRHENIGEGHIGSEGFRNLLQEPRLRAVPWLLEVPGFDEEGPDKKNIDRLFALAKK